MRCKTRHHRLSQVVLRNPLTSYKLAKQDFRDYGGKFKAIYVKVSLRWYLTVNKPNPNPDLGAGRPETLHEYAQKQGTAAVGVPT